MKPKWEDYDITNRLNNHCTEGKNRGENVKVEPEKAKVSDTFFGNIYSGDCRIYVLLPDSYSKLLPNQFKILGL